jgi:hypothetical protein
MPTYKTTCKTLNIKVLNYSNVVGKPEGKKQLGRRRRRWVDNIKMDFRERGWGCMYWIDLAEYKDQWRALVNRIMHRRVP